jgi:hypothetical protein
MEKTWMRWKKVAQTCLPQAGVRREGAEYRKEK